MKDLERIIENAFEAGFREAVQGPKPKTDSSEPRSGARGAAGPQRFEKTTG